MTKVYEEHLRICNNKIKQSHIKHPSRQLTKVNIWTANKHMKSHHGITNQNNEKVSNHLLEG